MKKIILIYLVFYSAILFSKDEKKKTYTESELNEIVEKRTTEKLDRVRPSKIVQFSKDLLKKEESLNLRDIELKKRENQLKINEKDFEKRLVEFRERQNKFIGCLDDIEKADKKRTEHMVSSIAGMKAQNAAAILSVQDPELSVKILDLLPAEKVSKIFNTMDKEISARLQKQYMSMKK